jgi:hypothetical protein
MNELLDVITSKMNLKYSYSKAAIEWLIYALRYNPDVCAFGFQCCHCIFSLTHSFRSHYGLGFDSASNRNVYKEYVLEGKCGGCV